MVNGSVEALWTKLAASFFDKVGTISSSDLLKKVELKTHPTFKTSSIAYIAKAAKGKGTKDLSSHNKQMIHSNVFKKTAHSQIFSHVITVCNYV